MILRAVFAVLLGWLLALGAVVGLVKANVMSGESLLAGDRLAVAGAVTAFIVGLLALRLVGPSDSRAGRVGVALLATLLALAPVVFLIHQGRVPLDTPGQIQPPLAALLLLVLPGSGFALLFVLRFLVWPFRRY